MRRVETRFERQKLWEEIWSEPLRTVAARYDISDVGLRKICVRLGVPTPTLGYWAKVQAGQKVPPRPALKDHTGPTQYVRSRLISEVPPEPDPIELVERRAFEAKPENRIVVSDPLTDPIPLVIATQKAYANTRKTDQRGLPEPSAKRILDLEVGSESIPRALKIFDSLAKALSVRKIPIGLHADNGMTVVTMQGEQMALRIWERCVRTEREPTQEEKRDQKQFGYLYMGRDRYTYHRTGELTLGVVGEFGRTTTVADGKRSQIELRLNDFLVKLVAEAFRRIRAREERARQEIEWAHEKEERWKREQARAEEASRLRELEDAAGQWKRALAIREYVSAAEAKVGTYEQKSEFGNWTRWARGKADEIDPLISVSFSIS